MRVLCCLAVWISFSGVLFAGGTPAAQPMQPAGSGAALQFGDAVSVTGGLDQPYRFWVEVPPAASFVQVDLFDPDVGLGGGAEATAGRDRARGAFDTAVRYRLLDPLGQQCAELECDVSTCSDNAWFSLYASAYGCTLTTDAVLDRFSTQEYDREDGTLAWGNSWVEEGDDGDPTSGEVRIGNTGSDGRLEIDLSGLLGVEARIYREVDLSGSGLGFGAAVLSFDYQTISLVATQYLVEVSSDGGMNYTTLEDLSLLGIGSGHASYDITSFISDETRIRFSGLALSGGFSGEIRIDNVQIAEPETVRDEFSTEAYNREDGTLDWDNPWIEELDDGSPSSGEIEIDNTGTDGRLEINVAALITGEARIYREVDLSPTGLNFQTAHLSFDYVSILPVLAEFRVQVSGDGGSSYTTLDTFGIASSGTNTYDISAFIADDTRVRFVGEAFLGVTSGELWVDNVQIAGDVPGPLLPGHWELVVDQSSSITTGDDLNAIGVRASDGDTTSSGVELNVYAESFFEYGANAGASRTYTHYPYVHAGCDLSLNDFDWDSAGAFDLTVPGAGSPLYSDATPSGNNAWQTGSVTGWTDSENATDYGIWTAEVEISSGANYGTLYLGEFDAAATPPTGQPEASTFDIYLPTDGGSAPAKPYLEQQVRWFTGPNPPDNGSTTTMTVTVRLVNPTPHAITFSATDLVSINVPGGGVTYAGGVEVSQGTVTAQPAVNGTGTISWNPGTVASSSTELLAYEVFVTPTSDGQTLNVTGTPASNGTIATYVDETCTGASPACTGVQLSRATPTLGPLCELSVTEDTLTYVKVDRFQTYHSRDGLVVEWESASEAGTMRYELWRSEGGDWRPVEGGRLSALFGAPQGGVYRLIDPRGSAGDRYLLIELDRRGERTVHGPYLAGPTSSFDDSTAAGFAAVPRQPVGGEATRLSDASRFGEKGDVPRRRPRHEVPRRDAGDRGGRTAAPQATDLLIRDPGLYRLAAGSIAGSLGLSTSEVRTRIGQGQLRLENRGSAVAWAPVVGNDGIFFYGEAIDSLYTLDNVYRLSLEAGSQMVSVVASPVAPAPENSYRATDRHEQDHLAALVLGLDPESDYWFWQGLTAGQAGFDTWNATLPTSALGSGPAELRIHLLGATLTGPGGVHEIDVLLDGDYLTTATWKGGEHTVEVAIDTADLLVGETPVALQALLPDGVGESFVFVDSVELTYVRQYQAHQDQLTFGAEGNGAITLSGFSATPVLLELSDPRHPILVTGAGTSFEPLAGDDRYFAAGPTAIREPVALRPVRRRDLLAEPAEMVLIVPAHIEHSVDDLVSHRQQQGLSVLRVTLDEVMDQFNHGIFDPHAIRDLLVAAESQWGQPPDYLTLVGAGNYDYRDLYGLGGQLMPPLLTATDNGLYAADDLYGDLDGDGVAEIAVGRIPATSYGDMWNYAQKVIAYETAEPSSDVLLISAGQRSGEAIDFAAENGAVAQRLDGRAEVEQLDLDLLGVDALRQQMFQALDAGPAFVNYFGHGAADVWGDAGILSLADLPVLDGGVGVYTGLTCLMNRFEVVGFDNLGSGLLFASGGAVAVWSPTAPETHGLSRAVGRSFYQLLANHDWSGESLRLGPLIRRVKAQQGSQVPGLATFLLMGDPALQLRFAPLPGDPPGSGSSGE